MSVRSLIATAGAVVSVALVAACSSGAPTHEVGSVDPPRQASGTPVSPGAAGAPENLPGYHRPARYAVTVTSSCGERNYLGSYRVTVQDGRVVRVRHANRSPSSVPQSSVPPLEAAPGLEGMQEIARQASADGADSVDLTYAPSGRLTGVSIDYLQDAIDDELCYQTSDFRPQVGR